MTHAGLIAVLRLSPRLYCSCLCAAVLPLVDRHRFPRYLSCEQLDNVPWLCNAVGRPRVLHRSYLCRLSMPDCCQFAAELGMGWGSIACVGVAPCELSTH
jgi:hypothetical protein